MSFGLHPPVARPLIVGAKRWILSRAIEPDEMVAACRDLTFGPAQQRQPDATTRRTPPHAQAMDVARRVGKARLTPREGIARLDDDRANHRARFAGQIKLAAGYRILNPLDGERAWLPLMDATLPEPAGNLLVN